MLVGRTEDDRVAILIETEVVDWMLSVAVLVLFEPKEQGLD